MQFTFDGVSTPIIDHIRRGPMLFADAITGYEPANRPRIGRLLILLGRAIATIGGDIFVAGDRVADRGYDWTARHPIYDRSKLPRTITYGDYRGDDGR